MRNGWRLLPLTCAALWVLGTEPWDDKPWTEWTERDVERVLERSPWSASYSFGSLTGPSIRTHVQWRSARPVAAAYVRMMQLSEPGISEETLR